MNTVTIDAGGTMPRLDIADAHALLGQPQDVLLARAAAVRDHGHGRLISYSRKVFIPLTQLCRDVCHYCTFAKAPRRLEAAFLSPDQVLEIARAGKVAGCKEALFTLGDKPELRYKAARSALTDLGYDSTIDYLEAMAGWSFGKPVCFPISTPAS